jgi:hypothetical protein
LGFQNQIFPIVLHTLFPLVSKEGAEREEEAGNHSLSYRSTTIHLQWALIVVLLASLEDTCNM